MLDKNKFANLDFLIRSGQVNHAAREIHLIFKTQKIHDKDKSTFANLARRSGLPLLSLKILTPLVWQEKHGLRDLNQEEILSYSAGLIALGAHQEGQELLRSHDLKTESQRWFFLGISAMNQWEYENAKNYFQYFLSCTDITSYQRHTASLNLTTSLLVIGELDQAIQIIQKAELSIDPVKEKLLHFYFFEQKVQWLIAKKKYQEALAKIQEIQDSVYNLPINYQLTIKKWRLAAAFYAKELKHEELSRSLDSLELEAHQRSMPELLREIDFYRALFLNDSMAHHRVFFGTGWKTYLKRMENNLGKADFAKTFEWSPRLWQKISQNSISMNSIQILHPKYMRNNGLQHKLLWTLSSDLYRQQSLGSLFYSLYQDERFDPWTSKDRLLKMIQRTQHSINAYHSNEVLKICNTRNRFYLRFDSPLILPYRPHHLQQEIKNEPILIAIYHKMKFQLFSNKDIRQLTGMSESQVYEELAKLSSRRLIDQYHRNGHRMYKISKKTIHPATEAKTAGNFFA